MTNDAIQAIIVLGSGITPQGEPSPGSALRTRKAVELHKLFPDAVLIMSGSSPLDGDYPKPEAEIMQSYAVSLGADSQKILLETESQDTLSNAALTKKKLLLPRQLHNVLVVTSGYHVPRAEYLFRKALGPEYGVTFVSAGGDTTPQRLAKEGRSLAFFRALLDTAPDGDDEEIWRRMRDWLSPYCKKQHFTLDEWHDYTDNGAPLPVFPDYPATT